MTTHRSEPPVRAAVRAHKRSQSPSKAPPSPPTPAPSTPPSDPRAADFARLLLSGVPAEEACRTLSIPKPLALSWMRSPEFSSLLASPESLADHVRRTYVELLPEALTTKAHLLRHGDDPIRDRVASEIINVTTGGLEDERSVLALSPAERDLLRALIDELSSAIDVTPDDDAPSD